MRIRRRLLAAAVSALVSALLVAHGAPAAAEEPAGATEPRRATEAQFRAAAASSVETWWHIRSWNSDLALAVSGSSDANGAQIIQWPARWQVNGLPALEQAWNPQNLGDYVAFLNAGTTPWKSFGISGSSTAQGAKAIQWTYNVSNTDQQWTIHYLSGNKFALINRNSNMCLAIPGGTLAQGTQAIQWPCNFSRGDQMWYFGLP